MKNWSGVARLALLDVLATPLVRALTAVVLLMCCLRGILVEDLVQYLRARRAGVAPATLVREGLRPALTRAGLWNGVRSTSDRSTEEFNGSRALVYRGLLMA